MSAPATALQVFAGNLARSGEEAWLVLALELMVAGGLLTSPTKTPYRDVIAFIQDPTNGITQNAATVKVGQMLNSQRETLA